MTFHITTQEHTPGTTPANQRPSLNMRLAQRWKDIWHNPLTFILLVWSVLFAVAGLCWLLIP